MLKSIRRSLPFALIMPIVALSLLCGQAIGRDSSDPLYDYRDDSERDEFDYDASQDIPWIENETEVLAVPKPDDLRRIDITEIVPGMQMLIDTSRITVDPEDHIIRFWVVMRSEAGAENATFEGFRCATREYKVYAFANPQSDAPARKAKRPRWRKVNGSHHGNYRTELLKDYLCLTRSRRTAGEIRDSLTEGFGPEPYIPD